MKHNYCKMAFCKDAHCLVQKIGSVHTNTFSYENVLVFAFRSHLYDGKLRHLKTELSVKRSVLNRDLETEPFKKA